MKTMQMLGLAAAALMISGLAVAGDGAGPKGKAAKMKGACPPPCAQNGKGPGACDMQGKGGPNGMGTKILMEKEDVKKEFETHMATMKALHEKIRALRESTRKSVAEAEGEEAKVAAATAAKAEILALFTQIIDERIRHHEAMLGFMKKYRDELIADIQENMDQNMEKRMEKRRENRENGPMKEGKKGPRGKHGGKGGKAPETTDTAEGSVF